MPDRLPAIRDPVPQVSAHDLTLQVEACRELCVSPFQRITGLRQLLCRRCRLAKPSAGTSSKVEMELASVTSERPIRSAVSLTDDHIQFQNYSRSSAQSVAVGHSFIPLNDFSADLHR